MKLVSSPKCSFCQVHDESLEHLLVHCKFTQIFWSAVTTWLNEFNIGIGYLNEKIILLGVTNQVENYKLINHILIIGKQVIYSCRCKNVKPRLTLFQIKVREVYKIKLMISKKNQREITNYEKWQPLLVYLV